jgi:flagellar biosynthetic protein FlhB
LRLPRQALEAGAAAVSGALLDLLWRAAAVLLILGSIDLYRQRRKLRQRLSMTKQEVRQEQKDLEGNPQIKARLRRLQREMRRRQMMRSVPEATVVVTNPAHYAVALKYDAETMPAPLVLAKGLDFLAQRIRAIAEEHRIPIVENPPLAQALYKSCEAGSEIPPHLYRAVAEILAYIYRLTRRM